MSHKASKRPADDGNGGEIERGGSSKRRGPTPTPHYMQPPLQQSAIATSYNHRAWQYMGNSEQTFRTAPLSLPTPTIALDTNFCASSQHSGVNGPVSGDPSPLEDLFPRETSGYEAWRDTTSTGLGHRSPLGSILYQTPAETEPNNSHYPIWAEDGNQLSSASFPVAAFTANDDLLAPVVPWQLEHVSFGTPDTSVQSAMPLEYSYATPLDIDLLSPFSQPARPISSGLKPSFWPDHKYTPVSVGTGTISSQVPEPQDDRLEMLGDGFGGDLYVAEIEASRSREKSSLADPFGYDYLQGEEIVASLPITTNKQNYQASSSSPNENRVSPVCNPSRREVFPSGPSRLSHSYPPREVPEAALTDPQTPIIQYFDERTHAADDSSFSTLEGMHPMLGFTLRDHETLSMFYVPPSNSFQGTKKLEFCKEAENRVNRSLSQLSAGTGLTCDQWIRAARIGSALDPEGDSAIFQLYANSQKDLFTKGDRDSRAITAVAATFTKLLGTRCRPMSVRDFEELRAGNGVVKGKPSDRYPSGVKDATDDHLKALRSLLTEWEGKPLAPWYFGGKKMM